MTISSDFFPSLRKVYISEDHLVEAAMVDPINNAITKIHVLSM